MTPRLIANGRRAVFARLIAFTGLEALVLFGAALAIRLALTAGERGVSPIPPAAMLVGLGLAVVVLGWLRAVSAEDFGLRWSNALRARLAEHAVLASHHQRRRLGTLTVRMTGDVNAARDWVSIGMPAVAVGIANTLAALAALYTAAGWAGFTFGLASLAFTALIMLAVASPLAGLTRGLRRARGRVSATVGDIALAAPALAWFDARRRAQKRAKRRGEELRVAAVAHRRWAEGLRAPFAVVAPVGVALAALGMAAPAGVGGWAAYLFALGLLTTALGALATGLDGFIAYRAARQRLAILRREARAGRAERQAGEVKLPNGDGLPVSVTLDLTATGGDAHQFEAKPRAIVRVTESQSGRPAFACVDALMRGGAQVRLGLERLDDLRPRDRARRIGWVSPAAPLIRDTLRANLRVSAPTANDDDLVRAVALARLEFVPGDLDAVIEPTGLDADREARLRLARAVVHDPRVMFIAEPALAADPAFASMLADIGDATGATIIAASATRAGWSGDGAVWDASWEAPSAADIARAALAQPQTADEDEDDAPAAAPVLRGAA